MAELTYIIQVNQGEMPKKGPSDTTPGESDNMAGSQIRLVAEEANIVTRPIKILCVDDEDFNLDIIQKHLRKAGYETITAENGQEAWDILTRNASEIDLILLDRMMPVMDGITLLKKVKSHPRFEKLPVIMQTAANSSEQVVEGIESGAYYYITKPYASEVLLSIVASAVRDHKEQQELETKIIKANAVLSITRSAHYKLKTHQQARELAVHLSAFSKHPSRVVVALTAILSNSIEHGNLEIGHDRKQDLLMEGKWEQELEFRMALPEYRNRWIDVMVERVSNGVKVRIVDEGKGFRWQEYIDFEPRRMTDPNGRGIAMANAITPGCLQYSGSGNKAIYMIKK